jgi:hypothetical protein
MENRTILSHSVNRFSIPGSRFAIGLNAAARLFG